MCIYVHKYVCVCMRVSTCVGIYAYIKAFMCVFAYVHACVCVRVRVCIFVCLCIFPIFNQHQRQNILRKRSKKNSHNENDVITSFIIPWNDVSRLILGFISQLSDDLDVISHRWTSAHRMLMTSLDTFLSYRLVPRPITWNYANQEGNRDVSIIPWSKLEDSLFLSPCI